MAWPSERGDCRRSLAIGYFYAVAFLQPERPDNEGDKNTAPDTPAQALIFAGRILLGTLRHRNGPRGNRLDHR